MATFAFIHGGGDSPWAWHLVERELRERGHETIAPAMPAGDPALGFADYADAVATAIGNRRDVQLVAHSFGGFTAPHVCERADIAGLILLAAMVPVHGERPADWWQATGADEAGSKRAAADPDFPDDEHGQTLWTFYADVDPELAQEALRRGAPQVEEPTLEPWPLERWPELPTRYLLMRDDNLFPADFLRRLIPERLGIEPDEIDGGHCVMLSRPAELAERLISYLPGGAG